MSTADNSDSLTKKERASARWAILRNALLKNKTTSEADSASIHRFAGFNLLPPPKPLKASPEMLDFLRRIPKNCKNVSEVVDDSLLAIQSLDSSISSIEFILLEATRDSMDSLVSSLKDRGITACYRPDGGNGDNSIVLKVERAPDLEWKAWEYEGQIAIRERIRNFSIKSQELQSHLLYQGVDNTGNVCIWDAEKTLVYYLSKNPPPANQDILELGVGMAGLAGLACAFDSRMKASPSSVTLTDGHPQAVQNNRVNIRLTQALQVSLLPAISCRRLLWTLDPHQETESCDLILVSDCTHFQDFHAELFWTIVSRLRVGGTALLCQPHRGESLNNFLALALEERCLLEVAWMHDEFLKAKHEEFQASNAAYDPNIHQAHVVKLTKARPAEGKDRIRAKQKVQSRAR